MKTFAAALCLLAIAAPALARTPQAAWKADLADTNKAYAQTKHAILKIQDAAYLGDGDSASLVGTRGDPGSYKWVPGRRAGAAIVASYAHGRPALVHDGKPLAKPLADVAVDKDVDVQAYPTQVQAGVQGIRVFVYNQRNPAATRFKGVDYFPYNRAYVVTARFTPDPRLPAQSFITSRKTSKQFYRAGIARFTLRGKALSLPFYTDTNDPSKVTEMSAFFTDGLTGKGTYAAGRYVDSPAIKHFPPTNFPIDFNYAYNPNCARSAFFTCPVAFDHLALAVSAGEKDPHAKH